MSEYLAAYLEALPQGLGSFARCRAKGSLLTTSAGLRPLRNLDRLPPELARYAAEPPLPSAWIPETHYVAWSLATADEGRMSTEAFVQFWREVMLALTDNVYSSLLGWLHPETILKTASARWAYFHEGSKMEVSRENGVMILQLETPPGLFHELLFAGYAGVLQGLVDRSRKPQGRARHLGVLTTNNVTRSRYELSGW